MDEKEFFIRGNVASGKNSKRWTGHTLIRSKAGMDYIKETESQYKALANKFRFVSGQHLEKVTTDKGVEEIVCGGEYPLRIGFYFIRKDKRKFDYQNMIQLPADMMQWFKWLPDDDVYHFIPVFLGFEVDKNNPGVLIKILES